MSLRIGFVGLGAMGMGMAQNLVKKGFEVKAYDRRPEAIATLANVGGKAATSVSDAATDADVFVIVVVNAQQAEDVLFGDGNAVSTLRKGAAVMLCSTVSAEFARDLGEKMKSHGLLFLDSPISGGPVKAASGEMSIMCSGKPEVFKVCDPVLEAMAQNVYRMGDEAGLGSITKTVNQLLAGVHIAASAEAMALGARAGLDPSALYEVISNSAGASWMFVNRVPHMLSGDYTPMSAVEIFIKDLGIVQGTSEALRFPTPIATQARQMFMMAASAGYGGEDDAAVVKVYEDISGAKVSGTGKKN